MELSNSKLINAIQKYGDVQVCKLGVVCSILITGKGLSNLKTLISINETIKNYVGDEYPVIEVMRNSDDFFMVVSRKSQPNA